MSCCIYTIGFTRKTASQFFEILRAAGIKKLIDVRLNNTSQLAGFSKREDLAYFLREICGAQYEHLPVLAPTQLMLDAFKKEHRQWAVYAQEFAQLLESRQVEKQLSPSLFATPTVLLCSEVSAEHCHRRVVVDYLNTKWGDVLGVDL